MRPPIFKLDHREKWRPCGVEVCAQAGAALVDARGRRTKLQAGWEYRLPNDSGAMLDFPPGMTQPDVPLVGYYRRVRGADLYWHQFWTWWLYNPRTYPIDGLGWGEHEGDWEFVQYASADADGERPFLATGSQHHTGEKREWWAVEQEAARVVVYVASGSHAMYFGPQTTEVDRADGKGRVIKDEIEWRPFGSWGGWVGRWGHSLGVAKSPASPGRQGQRWHAPHLYHRSARAG